MLKFVTLHLLLYLPEDQLSSQSSAVSLEQLQLEDIYDPKTYNTQRSHKCHVYQYTEEILSVPLVVFYVCNFVN